MAEDLVVDSGLGTELADMFCLSSQHYLLLLWESARGSQ